MILDDRDLPRDPREENWTPAHGPDGPAWVWFDVDVDHWIVWDEHEGYRKVSNSEFERAYELNAGTSTYEVPEQGHEDQTFEC
jgi:hypothetical protein